MKQSDFSMIQQDSENNPEKNPVFFLKHFSEGVFRKENFSGRSIDTRQTVTPIDTRNVSRHDGGPIEASLEPLGTILPRCLRGFKEAFNCSPHYAERC